MVVLTCNPGTTETRAGRSEVVGLPELHRETLPQQRTAKHTEKRCTGARDRRRNEINREKIVMTWGTPATPALGRLKLENGEFKIILGSGVSSRSTWATWNPTSGKKRKQKVVSNSSNSEGA